MSAMFESVPFRRGPAMPNRIALAPLTNQQSNPDGTLGDDEHRWLTMRADGGFGMVMTCAAWVNLEGLGFHGQLGAASDDHIEGLRRLAEGIGRHGAVTSLQIHHAGNRSVSAVTGMAPVSASEDTATGTRALTTEEVESLVGDFVAAAGRAEAAGFHGIELHGAHGYMIAQFLSAEINRRTDRYGGSLENRARLLVEIIDGIRDRCGPDFQIGVRLSPERFGMVIDEVREVMAMLADSGKVDYLDLSMWDVHKEAAEEAWSGQRLLDIFCAVPRGDMRLGAAGKMYSGEDITRALDAGLDFVFLGRAGILHHDFPEMLRADPSARIRDLPVSVETLHDEGLSDRFVVYMRSWKGFVAD
jgi:2,4-dienoyl-CoA reductase-like NADH-dependent reductase (Old Yellow Enzyme family)